MNKVLEGPTGHRLIALLVLASISAGCIGGIEADDVSAAETSSASGRVAADWIDYDAIDHSVRPADDFYQFVNGRWLQETEIPSDVPWISPYVENYFKVRARLKRITADLVSSTYEEGSDEQRVAELYRSYMDADLAGELGLDPLMPVLSAIDEVDSLDELTSLFATFNQKHFRQVEVRNRYSVPFVITARPDDRDSSEMVASLRPAGLGMANRNSYVSYESQSLQRRAQYLSHIEATLQLAHTSEASKKAASVLALETRLAEAALSPTAQMHHNRNYNKLARLELEQLVPELNWDVYLTSAGLGDQNAFLVADVEYFKALNEMLRTVPLESWKSYLRWQLLRIYSPYLPSAFVEQDFAFFGQIEMGKQEPMARQERATIIVEQAFPELLGRLYVERYFSAEAKAHVTQMAEAIRRQFRLSIEGLDWMTDETRQAALNKLANMNIKIGYPTHWRTYKGIRIDAHDLLGNLMRINADSYQRDVDRIGQPIDHTVWQTPAYASSAYYYRVMNELAIPAGYLLPPWYDINAEPAMNYGGIGTVVAHEMGHAFDNQGSEYDGCGNLNDWWSEGDRRRFVELTNRLVAQYSQYSPGAGRFVDGALTLSENIADLTGVTMAYRAFRAETHGMMVPVVEGFTGEQRFFIAFATHWRALYSEPLLNRILYSDGHPPQKYRTNGPLANFFPFYDAFGVRQGDGMFLANDQRVSIW